MFRYLPVWDNCQMRFIDIFKPDFTDDSMKQANSKLEEIFFSLEELKLSDELLKNASYAAHQNRLWFSTNRRTF